MVDINGKFEAISLIEEVFGIPIEIKTETRENCVNGFKIKDYVLNIDFS